MPVAVICGSLLRPWGVPNYAVERAQVRLIASRTTAGAGTDLPVTALPSLADLRLRLPARAAMLAEYVAGSAEYLIGLERALRGHDVVHAPELSNPCTLQAIEARDRGACGRVVVGVMENVPFQPDQRPAVDRRKRAVAARADHFVAMTERARVGLELFGVPADRITVLPNGVDTERFRPADRRAPDGPLRLLSVARLEPSKGVEDLVLALGLLVRRGVDATLTLAGEGPLRPRLERVADRIGVRDRLAFESVPWPRVGELLHAHDVFVLASAPTPIWREQLGFAVLEAMACGLPVLAGDSGSLMEVVDDPEQLVRPHDPLSLAERIERLAGAHELRARLGAHNRTRALEHYDLVRQRTRLRALFDDVVARPVRAA